MVTLKPLVKPIDQSFDQCRESSIGIGFRLPRQQDASAIDLVPLSAGGDDNRGRGINSLLLPAEEFHHNIEESKARIRIRCCPFVEVPTRHSSVYTAVPEK
jgi:hypothetical protein